MTSLWLAISLLVVLAIGFVLWPWIRFRRQTQVGVEADGFQAAPESNSPAERLAENVRLFREHIAELDVQLADGRLGQAQYAQLKLEHQRALLDEEAELRAPVARANRSAGLVVFLGFAVALVAAALVFYFKLGASQDVAIQVLQIDKQFADYQDMLANRDPSPAHTQAVIAAVEQRLQSEPNSVQYWFVLARSAMEIGDFAKAAKAYQQVLNRDQQSGMIMAEAAQAMFLRDGNQVSPPVVDLTKGALALEPENTMALGLMGIIDFNQKNFPAAIKDWQKAIKLLGPNSGGVESLQKGIERAQAMYLANGGTQQQLDQLLAGRQLTLQVALGEGVKVTPDQWVYVYARVWQGPKIPLAITRIKASDLPTQVTLTEAMAMSPMASLANATQVELVARISQDGTANAKAGDWQGNLGPLDMAKLPESLQVTIDHQVAQ